ncbi:lipase [Streptococcus sp. KCJ4932]|uniref:prolyl oligopeptidase family serine peptidase n=1 Tax=Streptococcus sp. KCJ4932 TaxID=2545465 RepID=UPI00105535B5|nr:prolyl oligopeptidase family serine peptidase [Streptococcus sp. KCJ4932]TDE68471.1 lipase [Streptococcus sp. KCJ4932]
MAKRINVTIAKVSMIIKGYECGPGVPKLLVQLTHKVSGVVADKLLVRTAGKERQISRVYLSDDKGQEVSSASEYLVIQMPVTFDSQKNAAVACPFYYNLETLHNTWVEDYPVTINGLEVICDGEVAELSGTYDIIHNRLSPDTDVFNKRGFYSGTYINPLTKENEKLTLHYVAYEPKPLKSGESFPLLIWLHGQGEGGVDTDITLLGNEVVALARPEIQSHFSTNDQKGVYVLAVQSPTYWMDEGDGTNGAGAGDSRYTEILMDTIKNYVASTPAVDTKRIYLAGCSNGGYMTINLAISNPGYFAALVPQAAAYSYYEYERNADGSYTISPSSTSFIRKDVPYFDEEKMLALKKIPMWFIHATNDTIVNPKDYSLPIYKNLLDSGAENKWFSYFESVEGTDMQGVSYLGHLSWIYFFKDQVSGVQDVSAIKSAKDFSGFSPSNKGKGGTSTAKVSGKTYHNIFDWLNDQKKA